MRHYLAKKLAMKNSIKTEGAEFKLLNYFMAQNFFDLYEEFEKKYFWSPCWVFNITQNCPLWQQQENLPLKPASCFNSTHFKRRDDLGDTSSQGITKKLP